MNEIKTEKNKPIIFVNKQAESSIRNFKVRKRKRLRKTKQIACIDFWATLLFLFLALKT